MGCEVHRIPESGYLRHRVAVAAVRHFVAVNAKGRLLSPNATIFVSEDIVFLCDFTLFSKTRIFSNVSKNTVSGINGFRASCDIALNAPIHDRGIVVWQCSVSDVRCLCLGADPRPGHCRMAVPCAGCQVSAFSHSQVKSSQVKSSNL